MYKIIWLLGEALLFRCVDANQNQGIVVDVVVIVDVVQGFLRLNISRSDALNADPLMPTLQGIFHRVFWYGIVSRIRMGYHYVYADSRIKTSWGT